jgi:hypothetical protein
MYHLLLEGVSIVTSEFLQYRARVWIGLNRAGCRTDWFIYVPIFNVSKLHAGKFVFVRYMSHSNSIQNLILHSFIRGSLELCANVLSCSKGLSHLNTVLLVFMLVAFCWTKSLSYTVVHFTGMPYQFRVFNYLEFISLIWKGPYYDKISVTRTKKEFLDSKKNLQSL